MEFDASSNLSRPKAEDLKFVRQSNLLAIEQAPFDRDTFKAEEEKFLDEAGNTRIRLTGNTIRWRHATDPITGEPYKQSNARFVRWSDGSLQLLLGSEVLDVAVQDIAADRNFMFSRQPQYIQAQAALLTKMAFRPVSVTSTFHKRLATAMGKQHSKQQKVRHVVTVVDPKRAKEEREKAEEERIRGRESLFKRQNAAMRRQTTKLPSRTYARAPNVGLSAHMLEAEDEYEDEEDDEGLNPTEAARRAVQRPRRDEAAEREAELRLASAKQSQPSARSGQKRSRPPDSDNEAISDEEEADLPGFVVEDDDEDDIGAKRQPRRGAALMLDDDDDD
ncbi:hypothetical protein WJX84_011659 [Apatococcus fuscideae]